MLTNVNDLFRDELNSGERILWSGQPKQGFLLRLSDAFMIPFSLIWGGLVFMGFLSVISSYPLSFAILIPGIFVLVSLYMIAGRFYVDIAQRRKTYYALTSERIIILSGLITKNVKSIKVSSLYEINASIKQDGTGTISFGPKPSFFGIGSNNWFNFSKTPTLVPSFEMIDDAQAVYQQIKNLQRELDR